MAKFNITSYLQIASPAERAMGMVGYNPFRPIGHVQVICPLEDLPAVIKSNAEAKAKEVGVEVFVLAFPVSDERKPNGWKKFYAAKRNEIVLAPQPKGE